jgi:hypothetical protein
VLVNDHQPHPNKGKIWNERQQVLREIDGHVAAEVFADEILEEIQATEMSRPSRQSCRIATTRARPAKRTEANPRADRSSARISSAVS